jgi:hypothetical protein
VELVGIDVYTSYGAAPDILSAPVNGKGGRTARDAILARDAEDQKRRNDDAMIARVRRLFEDWS